MALTVLTTMSTQKLSKINYTAKTKKNDTKLMSVFL